MAVIVWVINITAILIYILTYNIIEPVYSKLIYLYSSVLTLIYCASVIIKGFESDLHKGLIVLSFSSLCMFFIFLILYYQFGIDDYRAKIGVFLLTELITICCVFISGLKHGLFNDAKDML